MPLLAPEGPDHPRGYRRPLRRRPRGHEEVARGLPPLARPGASSPGTLAPPPLDAPPLPPRRIRFPSPGDSSLSRRQMAGGRGMPAPAFSLLSRLWLAEPNAQTLALAAEVGLPCTDDPAAMSAAWTDLFLLNVYPYGSAFTDPAGELNGPSTAWAEERYASADYD